LRERRARNRGGRCRTMKTLKSLVGIGVVVAVFYVAFKLMPVYFNEYQFEDSLEQIARYSAYQQNKTEDDIRNEVMKKAREFDIPIQSEQININRQGTNLVISTEYNMHIDLPMHPLDLKFKPTSKKT
jgi:hypothetical protein